MLKICSQVVRQLVRDRCVCLLQYVLGGEPGIHGELIGDPGGADGQRLEGRQLESAFLVLRLALLLSAALFLLPLLLLNASLLGMHPIAELGKTDEVSQVHKGMCL